MVVSFKARKMVAGKDTLSTMAMHYGITTSVIVQVIKAAGTLVIREDGFRGLLADVRSGEVGRPRLGWSDGLTGIDPETTKLTMPAIMAVARWKFSNTVEENL